MSLARAALFAARPQRAYLSRIQCRSASSQSHSHDEHHGTEDVSYPKEGMLHITHVFFVLVLSLDNNPHICIGIQDSLLLLGPTH